MLNTVIPHAIRIIFFSTLLTIAACSGGGGGSGGGTTSFAIHALVDPNPGTNDYFGMHALVLTNGNIVVADPNDSSAASSAGSVRIYSATTQTLITSIDGNNVSDGYGNGGLIALPNNNFVISSISDTENGLNNAGSVTLVNGSNGAVINKIAGDDSYDRFGSGNNNRQSIFVLANSNFVVLSEDDNENAVNRAGSVRLIDGNTGMEIVAAATGTPVVGAVTDDFDIATVITLGNNNFVIGSSFENVGGLINVGTVRLMNGATGAQISSYVGDVANDRVGEGVTQLKNSNNYVISSRNKDVGGVANVGSVMLMNGVTGAQIGTSITGNDANDAFGNVIPLANGNYVIHSDVDKIGTVVRVGSVRLVDGTNGLQIGAAVEGDNILDSLGESGVVALPNSNFVVASKSDDIPGASNVGSVKLISGSDASVIATLFGDFASDFLGYGGIVALPNNNFVILSPRDDENGVVDAGSIRLIGSDGVQVNSIVGDVADDELGTGEAIALANNNFVVSTSTDDVNSIVDAGSVMLISGTTGLQIGAAVVGDNTSDSMGTKLIALNNNIYAIHSEVDDVDGLVDAGSLILINGVNGSRVGETIGGVIGNLLDSNTKITLSSNNDFFILSNDSVDVGGFVDSGVARQIRY